MTQKPRPAKGSLFLGVGEGADMGPDLENEPAPELEKELVIPCVPMVEGAAATGGAAKKSSKGGLTWAGATARTANGS